MCSILSCFALNFITFLLLLHVFLIFFFFFYGLQQTTISRTLHSSPSSHIQLKSTLYILLFVAQLFQLSTSIFASFCLFCEYFHTYSNSCFNKPCKFFLSLPYRFDERSCNAHCNLANEHSSPGKLDTDRSHACQFSTTDNGSHRITTEHLSEFSTSCCISLYRFK